MKHSPEQEKILAKLEKLVKLEEGAREIGSLEEAANAAARIQELLTKYNLSLADVQISDEAADPNPVIAVEFDLKDTPHWQRNESTFVVDLMSVVCRYNNAKMIIRTRGGLAKMPPIFMLFAQEGTHEFLIQLFGRINYQIRRLEADAWAGAKNGPVSRGKYKRDYFLGACHTIGDRLREMHASMEEEHSTGLMVIGDKLKKAVDERYGKSLGTLSRRSRDVSSAYAKGASDAKGISTGAALT